MTYTRPEPCQASPWIRFLGRVSRSTPYFKGKWRVMGWIHRRWFVKKRMWDDARLSFGTVVACDLWDEVQFDMWWGGETYEIRQTPDFKSLLKPQCVVFDIGANAGYYSLIAAPLVGPEGRIYAFEPAAEQFRRLKDNATRNGFSQILPFKLALCDRVGEAVLHLDDEFNTGSASLRPAGARNIRDEIVKCTTLDDFVESKQVDRIDVMKIDVEGCELAVLRGGQRALDRLRPILLIEVKEHHQRLAGFSSKELYDQLIAQDYRPYRIHAHARLSPIDEPEDGILIAFRHVSQAV